MQLHSIITPWFQTHFSTFDCHHHTDCERWRVELFSYSRSVMQEHLNMAVVFVLPEANPVLSHYLETVPCIAGWNDLWMLHNKGCKVDFSCSEFTLCLFLLETGSRFAGHTNKFPSFFDSTRRLTLWNGPTEKLQLILATTDQRDPILLIDILAIAFPIWHHLLDLLGFLSWLVHLTNWYCRSSCS